MESTIKRKHMFCFVPEKKVVVVGAWRPRRESKRVVGGDKIWYQKGLKF
jgi:hypothetical protein